MKRIKIAYISINDPKDKRSWSGTTYYIGQTLEKYVGDVEFLGPVKISKFILKILNIISKLTSVFQKKDYAAKYSLLLSWHVSVFFSRKMKGKKYDCIVAPAASVELGFLHTSLPIIYISDTTSKLILNYYKNDFGNISAFSKWESNFLEKRALRKSNLIIYPSSWAANSAVIDYKISLKKIKIMPLGANMDIIPDRSIIIKKHDNKQLTLLFLAVEWDRKGGPIAFETLIELHARGVKAKLVVCGCIPPADFLHPFMEVIAFLNKNERNDYDKFVALLSEVHFLVLPTRADCSLLVASESNAYGVPAIATNTGGVSDVIKDGVNGYCLPYEARGEKYADIIADIFSDTEEYQKLVLSSRLRFEEHLNWNKWADNFKQLYADQFLRGEIN